MSRNSLLNMGERRLIQARKHLNFADVIVEEKIEEKCVRLKYLYKGKIYNTTFPYVKKYNMGW